MNEINSWNHQSLCEVAKDAKKKKWKLVKANISRKISKRSTGIILI